MFALWAPACIQLMVKAFATSTWELREKALISFQALRSGMEQFAEYWGLGQAILRMLFVSHCIDPQWLLIISTG